MKLEINDFIKVLQNKPKNEYYNYKTMQNELNNIQFSHWINFLNEKLDIHRGSVIIGILHTSIMMDYGDTPEEDLDQEDWDNIDKINKICNDLYNYLEKRHNKHYFRYFFKLNEVKKNNFNPVTWGKLLELTNSFNN